MPEFQAHITKLMFHEAPAIQAEELENKLLSQEAKNRDPRLYNNVVKQWFLIFQTADVPREDSRVSSHLMNLTGSVPRMGESPYEYLKRVSLPEDGSKPVVIDGEK